MSLRIIGGEFKGRLLKTPKGNTTRPTQSMVREALFNICQNCITNSCFLDLFAGSGSMGFEALSRGASHVSFIEKDKNAACCIRENIEHLQVQAKSTLYPIDFRIALKKLEKKGELFDLIYIDPPYHHPIAPLLEELIPSPIFKPKAMLFVEIRSSNAIPFSSPHLLFINSRKFGDALLQQYVLAN